MHLDKVLEVVGHDIDPVVNHTVSAGAIPLQVLDMPRRVHELQPLGDAGEDGPAVVPSSTNRDWGTARRRPRSWCGGWRAPR